MATLQAPQPAGATPSAVAPPPGHPRFPLIDALRAIAALSVLVYHCGQLTASGGPLVGRLDAGVTLFFVISGFLLYRPFVAHRTLGAPGIRLRDYARRRLLRILPAYWLALTLLAIWPGLPGVFSGHFWVYYGFAQVYSDNTVLQGLGPAWTLCVEMSFYVALPVWAALAAVALRGRSRRVQAGLELLALAALAAGSLALRWYLVADEPFSWIQSTLAVYADWFAVGMAIAVVSVARQGSAAARPPAAERVLARAPWLAWLVAIALFAAAAELLGGPHRLLVNGHTVLLFSVGENLGVHILSAAAAAALLAPAVFGTDGGGWVRRLLSWPVLAWLGLISYGIYLYQQPLLSRACAFHGFDTACTLHGPAFARHAPIAALLVWGLIASVLCAAASYHLVERPILRFKTRRS